MITSGYHAAFTDAAQGKDIDSSCGRTINDIGKRYRSRKHSYVIH